MRKLLLLFVSMLLFSCISDYKKLEEDEDFTYGVYKTFEKADNGCYIFTFEKRLKSGRNTDVIRRILVKSKKIEGYANYSYSLMRIKYDFKNNEETVVSIRDYNSNDSLLYSNDALKDHFQSVSPEDPNYVVARQLLLRR